MYESRPSRRQKIRFNNANDDCKLLFQGVKNGAKITPVSATIAIYGATGTAIVTATATGVSISGTLLTYAVVTTTTSSYPVATGYRAHWILTDASSITHEFDQIFDVVKFVPFGWIGRDQLVALCDKLQGAEHNGDEDFSEIIEACRDILQLDLESKAIKDDRLVEDMILDQSRTAVVARFLILSYIMREKGFPDEAEFYEKKYNEYLDLMLSSVKYDKGQDLVEDTNDLGARTQTRLIT